MAEKKKDDEFTAEAVYPVTHQAPTADDQQAAVVGDAGHEDSPVRTARPDVPIAAVMAAGVGEHHPTDPEEFDRDGRPVGPIEVADNESIDVVAEAPKDVKK